MPSSGRPRCDVTITAAPACRQAAIAGTEARMRVSSVIWPASSCGTLRSARIKTRLPASPPAASNAASVCGAAGFGCASVAWEIVILATLQRALASATAVSSMRLEKPHSLSYQAETLTSVPLTLVSVASKVDEAGLWLKSTETSGAVL
ncbi:hypothetical protein D9M69_594790 [compost metagenome]